MNNNTNQPAPANPRRHVPLWVTVLSVVLVAIASSAVTALLMREYHVSVDRELSGEVASQEALTVNLLPTDSDFIALSADPHWQLQNFTWLTRRKVTDADLKGLDSRQRRILRNAIFAINGYSFKDRDLRNFFGQFPWYNPTKSFMTLDSLTPIERENVMIIRDFE